MIIKQLLRLLLQLSSIARFISLIIFIVPSSTAFLFSPYVGVPSLHHRNDNIITHHHQQQPRHYQSSSLKSPPHPPHRSTRHPHPPPLFSSSSSSSFPSDKELATQKFETAESFSSYNDGSWKGSYTSFTLGNPRDPAAGVTDVRSDGSYTTEITTSLEDSGLLMTERIVLDDDATERQTRVIGLGGADANVDVDHVDGSYSMTVPSVGDLPRAWTSRDDDDSSSRRQWAVEHGIAASDDERVRLFVIYNRDDDDVWWLHRVVVGDERRLVDAAVVAAADETKRMMGVGGDEDRMAALARVLRQTESSSNGDDVVISRHPMSLFGLVAGVWLGDAVVRRHRHNAAPSAPSSGGFGRSGKREPRPGSGLKDGFAEWSTGVQKMTMTYFWDYETSIRRRVDVGVALGEGLGEVETKNVVGVVVGVEGRRDPKRRIVALDLEGGEGVGYIVGSVLVTAPRSIVFSKQTSNRRSSMSSKKSFMTEFAVFQKRSTIVADNDFTNDSDDDDDNPADGETAAAVPEIFCSRSTRTYGSDGRLRRGTNSFFSLNRSVFDKQ